MPRAANRRAPDAGNNDDDAHRRIHCVAVVFDRVGFVVANALDSTLIGDLVVMCG